MSYLLSVTKKFPIRMVWQSFFFYSLNHIFHKFIFSLAFYHQDLSLSLRESDNNVYLYVLNVHASTCKMASLVWQPSFVKFWFKTRGYMQAEQLATVHFVPNMQAVYFTQLNEKKWHPYWTTFLTKYPTSNLNTFFTYLQSKIKWSK